MSGDDIKTAVAALAVLFTGVSVFYTIRRNRTQDSAGSVEALLTGWDNQVKALASANKDCESRLSAALVEIDAMKKTTEKQITDLEDEAARMRRESGREAAAMYAEIGRLREQVREQGNQPPPGGTQRPPAG